VVDVLVILDGASEPVRVRPTSLERARTPILDRLARRGTLARLRTVPPGLPAGSEHAITTLLGWPPPAPVDRGALEAAAREIAVAPGERAWRVDVVEPDGGRGGERRTAAAAARLADLLTQHAVEPLGGHRLLVCGPPPLPPLPEGLRAWPEGAVPPRLLDESTTLIAAAGAAAGIGRLMGASVVVPHGATGRPDTDLAAKAAAAEEAVAAGAATVVVHVAAPDEAAHERDRPAKVRAIERADQELVAPLARLVAVRGGALTVCPDHGCDPHTGEHDGSPVPALWWTPVESGTRLPAARLTERAVAALPVTDPVARRQAVLA
jgi:2,3-bisphosphoglycerate-independent phosphoglycerate mutase